MAAPSLIEQDLFTSGSNGYHTYRIPTLAVTNSGTLLAICEGRKCNTIDYGHINLVFRRSTDNGQTWEPMQIIWDGRANTAGNPAPVVDRHTGTIWLLCALNNRQLFAIKSSDDGLSWSEPEATLTGETWSRVGAGPCHGIQLAGGRLIVPGWIQAVPGPHPVNYSQVFYSDDHGRTWCMGAQVGPYMNESVAVELDSGDLYLNMRNYTNRRAFAVSRDGGETFGDIAFDEALIDSECQASMIRYTGADGGGGRSRILFANPACDKILFGYFKRYTMTVRVSEDQCRTWAHARVLHLGSVAYCDLAIAADGTIFCLYERADFPRCLYEKIRLARFNIEWLTDGANHLS